MSTENFGINENALQEIDPAKNYLLVLKPLSDPSARDQEELLNEWANKKSLFPILANVVLFVLPFGYEVAKVPETGDTVK